MTELAKDVSAHPYDRDLRSTLKKDYGLSVQSVRTLESQQQNRIRGLLDVVGTVMDLDAAGRPTVDRLLSGHESDPVDPNRPFIDNLGHRELTSSWLRVAVKDLLRHGPQDAWLDDAWQTIIDDPTTDGLSDFAAGRYDRNVQGAVRLPGTKQWLDIYERITEDISAGDDTQKVKKFWIDAKIWVGGALQMMGPRNKMQSEKGFDAGFELSRMQHFLHDQYEDLPGHEQRPELRMQEAVIAEELALLWRPDTPEQIGKKQNVPNAFLFDTNDANLPIDEYKNAYHIQNASSPEKRWRIAGAHQAREAADIFGVIAESKTASPEERGEAKCRQVDMQLRSLSILSTTTQHKQAREKLAKEYASVNHEFLSYLTDQMSRITKGSINSRDKVRKSALFEWYLVAAERQTHISNGDMAKLVRLALPREDTIHLETPTIYTPNATKLSISEDVIVEDLYGNAVRRIQAKFMTPDEMKGRTRLKARKYLDDIDVVTVNEPENPKSANDDVWSFYTGVRKRKTKTRS